MRNLELLLNQYMCNTVQPAITAVLWSQSTVQHKVGTYRHMGIDAVYSLV